MSIMREYWERHFLRLELAVALTVTAFFFWWSVGNHGSVLIEDLLKTRRPTIYGALTSMAGSLLGFSLTITSIAIGFSQSDRMKVVRESPHYRTMMDVFISSNRAMGLMTLASLACLIFDRDGSLSCLFYALIFATVFGIFRIGRALWVLENILHQLSLKSESRKEGT